MFKDLKQTGRWTAIAGATAVRYRRLACEWLEDRRMLSLGDLLQTLNNPAPGADEFGSSVAVAGNIVVVGAREDNAGATDAGSAYILDTTTGDLLHTLNNPSPALGDEFGYSVAVSGNTVVVGAPSEDTGTTDAGSAYIFDAMTGALLHTLNNPTPAVNDRFAHSVAVLGNTVVIGAPAHGTGAGAAYIYDATTGSLLRTLTGLASFDYFGASVAMSGTTVVVGAERDDAGAGAAGAAYVFDAATGNLRWTLNNPMPAVSDRFGVSVAVSGSTVVVGAAKDDAGATDVGSAYIFDAATGNLLHTLNNPTPLGHEEFGISVAVSGSTVVVGAHMDNTGATGAGAAYIFDAAGGSLLGTLNNPTPADYDFFGGSVSVSGSRVVVGAWGDNTGAGHAGSAYLFDSTPGNTSVSLVGNDLFILDDAAGGKDDDLSISWDTAPSPDEVVIHDPTAILGHNDIPGATGEGTDTLRVPVTVFGGQIIVATGAGDDTLTVDFSKGSPFKAAGLVYQGGTDGSTGDQLHVTGTSNLSAVYRPDGTTPGSGSVEVFDGSTSRYITFTGLEPIDVSTMQTVSLETPNGADSVTLEAIERDCVVPGNLLDTLNNPAPAASDHFGRSVAVSGSTAVVGAPDDNTAAADAGSASIFDPATGSLLRTLNNPTPAVSDNFGYSVAVSGDTVVIGAPYDDTGATDAGSAYVFDTGTGRLLWTLDNPTPAASDYFGYSVCVSGSMVVVGAQRDDTGATDAGSAYVFDAATGNLLRTLNNPAPAASDQFGNSVSVSGNTVVVGAWADDAGASNAGSVYVFDAATGNLLRTLNNPTPAASDYFGFSVAVTGSTIVVGAHYDDTGGTNAGSAYIFDAATGNLLRTLNNPSPATSDYFGCCVAVSGNAVVVGAYYDDTGASDAGCAYVFDAATGNLLHTLSNPAPDASDYFGYCVAVSGSTVVVGAYGDDTGATNAGAAYVFGNLVRTLNNPTPGTSDVFGFSAAVSGSTVVVGAQYDDTGASAAGAAYLFDAATGDLLRTLNNPTPAANDYFGSCVAVSGRLVVVGAPYDDTSATDAGSAYIFDATTGNLLWTLNDPTPTVSDYFGISVSVSGSTVVVGAYRDDTGAMDAGSAYIFDATTGNLLRTLNNPTPAASDYFGYSVSVSGSTVVVGAYSDDTDATSAGSAYFFDAGNGNLLHTLNNPTPLANDEFGISVSVSGSMVVVGARSEDTGAAESGAAYLFDAATGNLLWTLNNPTPASSDYFGRSVSVSGNVVVVGAHNDDAGAANAGSAYLFDAGTGDLFGTLNNPTPASGDYFGYCVSVSGNSVVVGAYSDNTGAGDAGSAYVFDADRVDATAITGTSDGVAFESLTVYDVGELILELNADPSAIHNHDEVLLTGDHVARGLESITTHLGTGVDDLKLAGVVDLGTGGQFRATGEEVNLTGTGTIRATLTGVDRIEATGALTLGTGGLDGFDFAGTLVVGAHTVTLSAADFARMGALTTLEGGVLAAPHGVALATGSTLQGRGAVAGRVAAQVGSTIFATGSLALGDANSYSGFFSDGELYVGPYIVTIHDRDQGVLGSLTEIGDSSPGTLSAPNGLLVENSKVLYGYGVVNDGFENQGHVIGEGSLPADELEFTGLVTGLGDFDGNILFSGGYSPGNSPAEVDFGGDVTFGPAATLYIEIGGTLAGADYDYLDVAGQAELGGSIVVSLIRSYVPVVGDTFVLMTAAEALTGEFSDTSLPTPPAGTQWELVADAHDLRLTLVAVPAAAVVGSHVFYNRSAWDGNDAAANASDDQAIASDKIALLPGQKATFANYTSYSRGINGIMIDIARLADPAGLSVADFEFRTGNNNNPASWSLLALDPALITVAVRPAEGTDGSDRVTIVLPDTAVKKTWLQVTVKATAATGLAAPDVHYWGNAIGDSGNSATDTAVNVVDALGVRANPHTLLKPAPIDDAYDYNRDKQVNVQDELLVRANPTTLLTDLNLIDLTGYGGAGEGEGEGEGEVGGWWLVVGGVPSEDGSRESDRFIPLLNESVLPHVVPQLETILIATERQVPATWLQLIAVDVCRSVTTVQPWPTGPVKEEGSHNQTHRTRWAADAHDRSYVRTLDEALQELLAEWKQF